MKMKLLYQILPLNSGVELNLDGTLHSLIDHWLKPAPEQKWSNYILATVTRQGRPVELRPAC